MEDLLAEEKEQRFSVQNMSIYLAMQLYVLYCRYAMERKKKEGIQKDEVWNIIQRVLLDTSKTVSLEEYAEPWYDCSDAEPENRKPVRIYSFQLQKWERY